MLIRNDILPDTSMGPEWYRLKYKSFVTSRQPLPGTFLPTSIAICRNCLLFVEFLSIARLKPQTKYCKFLKMLLIRTDQA